MTKFIFTYSLEGQPFVGGWTEVNAPSEELAIKAFQLIHPNKDGFLNCGGVYSEAAFANTSMGKVGENFGAGCREIINLSHELVNE